MAGNSSDRVFRQVHRVLSLGAVGMMPDAQLLEWFVSERDESAEAAFEELMIRHGPMVFGVCRRVLQDAHDAEDAYQAAFLVLAKLRRFDPPEAFRGELAVRRCSPCGGSGEGSGCAAASDRITDCGTDRRGLCPIGGTHGLVDASRGSRPFAGTAPCTAGALLPRGVDLRRGRSAAWALGGKRSGAVWHKRESDSIAG